MHGSSLIGPLISCTIFIAVETDMYMFREIEMTSIYRKLETLYPENDYTGKNRI